MPNWITVEDSLKGRERAVEREREHIISLLKAEIERVSNPMLVDREYLDGLEVAIELVKGEQNPHVRAETDISNTSTIVNIVNSACSCGFKEEESGSPLCGCGCGDLYGEQNHE